MCKVTRMTANEYKSSKLSVKSIQHRNEIKYEIIENKDQQFRECVSTVVSKS